MCNEIMKQMEKGRDMSIHKHHARNAKRIFSICHCMDYRRNWISDGI